MSTQNIEQREGERVIGIDEPLIEVSLTGATTVALGWDVPDDGAGYPMGVREYLRDRRREKVGKGIRYVGFMDEDSARWLVRFLRNHHDCLADADYGGVHNDRAAVVKDAKAIAVCLGMKVAGWGGRR